MDYRKKKTHRYCNYCNSEVIKQEKKEQAYVGITNVLPFICPNCKMKLLELETHRKETY